MKVWILIPVGAGIALLGYGALQGTPKVKALQRLGGTPADPNVVPKHDPSTIPEHIQGQGKGDATYCELLTAYRQDLKRWRTARDDAKMRMTEVVRKAQTVCHDFAQEATWSYAYGGFLGTAGWTTLTVTRPAGLKVSCTDYVKGIAASPGNPRIKAPPTRGANIADNSWPGVADRIRKIQQQVESARAALSPVRETYVKAKADYDQAKAKTNDLEKKIADLEAQGVFC